MTIADAHAAAIVAAAVFGLAGGSFAGVLADRVPRGESIVSPPSHCTSCQAPLRPYDNLPVVSYLILRGRCRKCGVRIPPRDLFVELATALLFAGVAWRVPVMWAIPSYCVLVAGLVALSAVDLEHKRLPTPLVYGTAIVAGVLLVGATAITHRWSHLLVAVIAAACCFAVFFLIWFLVPKGMGFGDVRLAGLCGAWLGWLGVGAVPVGILGSFVLAGLPAIVLLVAGKANRKTQLPFGPFLAAGTVVGILFGTTIAHFWLHV